MERANIKLKNGQTVSIYQDMSAESPREWDNLGTMVCFHTRYSLGDNHDIDHNDYNSFSEIIKANTNEADMVLPLFLYDHSDITMGITPFHCRWDSGQVGYITISKEKIIKEYGNDSIETRANITRYLRNEVETYSQYLEGECYGYILKDSEGEEIDSCFGFYGYDPTTNGIFDQLDIGEEDVA